MAKYTSNLEQLIAAGLIQEDNRLSDEDVKTINNLSQEEVNCLVKTAENLGHEYLKKVMNPMLKVY